MAAMSKSKILSLPTGSFSSGGIVITVLVLHLNDTTNVITTRWEHK